MFINTTIPTQSEAAFVGEHIRIVEFAGKQRPSLIYLFIFCSCFNFRTLTQAETLAAQAR